MMNDSYIAHMITMFINNTQIDEFVSILRRHLYQNLTQ